MKKLLHIVLALMLSIFTLYANQAHEDNCLYFDGENDYVDLGKITEISGVNQFTLEMWVNVETWTSGSTLFSKRTSEDDHVQLQLHPTEGKLSVSVGPSFYVYTNDLVLPLKEWAHVAIVYNTERVTNAEKLEVFVNGVNQELGALSAPAVADSPNEPVYLGVESDDSGDYHAFHGKIDDVRIWLEARTQIDILENMSYSLSGYEENLLSYYSFNQGKAGKKNNKESSLEDVMDTHPGSLENFAMSGASSNFVLSEKDDIPEVQASGIQVMIHKSNRVRLSWEKGSGAYRTVFAKQTTTGSPWPINNQVYYHDEIFGLGDQIGETGWYCVYKGPAHTVHLENLMPGTNYRFMVAETNGKNHNQSYNNSVVENENIITVLTSGEAAKVPDLTVTMVTPSDLTPTSAKIGATIDNANGTLQEVGVYLSTHQNFDIDQEGTKYAASSISNDFKVEVTGLSPDVVYYYYPYAINENGMALAHIAAFILETEVHSFVLKVIGDGFVDYNRENCPEGEYEFAVSDDRHVSLEAVADNDRVIMSIYDTDEGYFADAVGQNTYVYNSPNNTSGVDSVIVTFSPNKYVARITDVFYTTLEAAIDDAVEEDTVYILEDCETEDIILESKKIAIDGQLHQIRDCSIDKNSCVNFMGGIYMESFLLESTRTNGSGQFILTRTPTVRSEETWFVREMCDEAEFNNRYWYAFSVPFAIDLNAGIYDATKTSVLSAGSDFVFMDYVGENRAKYGASSASAEQADWQRSESLIKGKAYMAAMPSISKRNIAFKAYDSNECFTDTTEVLYEAYTGNGGAIHQGWNFLAQSNPANVTVTPTEGDVSIVQVLRSGGNNQTGAYGESYYEPVLLSTAVLSPFSAYMCQTNANGKMKHEHSRNEATVKSVQNRPSEYFELSFSDEDANSDKLFVSGSYTASVSEYEVAKDLVKAGSPSTTRVQIWAEEFGERLAAIEGRIVNEELIVPLYMSIPENGTFTLALSGTLSASTAIYLLYKGEMVARLDDMPYQFTAQVGIVEDYSLKLVYDDMLTDIEDAVEGSAPTSFNVYTLDGAIYFEQASGEVEVYDVVGKLVYQGEDASIKVPQGVYTVIEGDTTIKLKVE